MSTPDLIVMEFRNGCGQTDLVSACVLLESSGPGFQDGRVGGMNEQRSRVCRTGDGGEDCSEGRI